jgi:hypothetical protein
MIQIRSAQMTALKGSLRDKFVEDLEESLRAAVPAWREAADLRGTIDQGIALAAKYGIETQAGIARFLEIAGAHNPILSAETSVFDRKILSALLPARRSEKEKLRALDAVAGASRLPPLPNVTPGTAVASCPYRAAASPVHWIEIRLVGEDGKPIPWTAYKVVLPTNEEVLGYLDGAGAARIECIEAPGSCQVSFPELDRDAWE